MSSLPGNPFAETHKVNGTLSEDDGEWAIAQATLALAYEQRTATLVALMTTPDEILIPGINYGEAARQIGPRLGLGENNA